jgi:pimeloyl-ACP methyl ester carboxylesterase
VILICSYGFSEGSVIGAALAARHPELAGLILQGAVARPFRELFRDQARLVGVPYLRSFAHNGQLTRSEIEQAIAGPGGRVANYLVSIIHNR